ncbi:MAG TPA: metallophosphoesterase [Egibacteraceae bacterium]|nr:metallophosphoesterase [Egibacteraceae bacterium]
MFRFLFMADCQLGCYASFSGMTPADVGRYAARGMLVEPSSRVDGWEWDARRFSEAVDAANRLRPDLVLMGGDMVNDPAVEGQYADVMAIASRLDGIPIHWVPGNHDIAFDGTAPTAAGLAEYRERFGPDHYAFEHRGSAFIVVNTVIWDRPENLGDQLDEQLAFLETSLRQARRDRSRHVLVFGHHPLFTQSPDEPDSYWNIPRARRRQVLELLTAFGARAFFCGHWHRNGGGWAGDLEVVVTGPVGYPLGVDPSGFRIVEVSDERVEHRYVALDGVAAAGQGVS